MNWTLTMLLGLSTLIPVGVGLARYNNIGEKYHPFLYYIFLGGFIEMLNDIFLLNGIHNTINANIYVLLSVLLMLWFFYRVNAIKTEKYFYLIIISFLGFWLYETFVIRDLNQIGSYYRIVYSFVIVLLSISTLNYILTSFSGNLLKNAIFLVCAGNVLFYTIKILIEIFWIYGLTSSKEFRVELYRIVSYTDTLTNIIYAFAILWMPPKNLSSQPS